ncbi:MAG: SRPBCC family protein [bacterium]|nr:SRPBCC family protein [bacterium]MDE0287364.1 SRPBCC family protein [bacterium]MDE0439193.1 SRPBCC family protein [bacterium]
MAEATIQTIEIDASPSACFDVAADLSAYPEWATEIRHVKIHERDADGRPRRVTLTIDAMIRQVTTTLRYRYEYPRSMSWTAEPGADIEDLEGSYEFHPVGEGTSVVYALRVVPSFDIPGFLRRQAEKQLVGTALRGLRRRVQGISPAVGAR